mmetsp:Transcript_20891/g.57930  ORF Transcript_20891/g.57930 Transcript_20891/m.57930 type:complete len:389 (+) Transcript_20891:361-1527(+)
MNQLREWMADRDAQPMKPQKKSQRRKKKAQARQEDPEGLQVVVVEGAPSQADERKAEDREAGPHPSDEVEDEWADAALEAFWLAKGVESPRSVQQLLKMRGKHGFLEHPEQILERLEQIQGILPPGLSVLRLINTVPRVVATPLATLRMHLSYLSGLLPALDMAQLLRHAPQVAASSTEAVKGNLKELSQMLPSLDMYDLISGEPRLLAASINRHARPSLEALNAVFMDFGEEAATKSVTLVGERPSMLLVPAHVIHSRWGMFSHFATTSAAWRAELAEMRKRPVVLAAALSCSDEAADRLEYLVQQGLGADLSMVYVVIMDPNRFTDMFPGYERWREVKAVAGEGPAVGDTAPTWAGPFRSAPHAGHTNGYHPPLVSPSQHEPGQKK